MIITDLRYDGGKNRFIVDTEGPRFFLSYETYQEYTLQKGMDITPYLDAFQEESDRLEVMDYVFRLLARKTVSSHEVIGKLKQRNVPEALTRDVIQYLLERNYLDDTRYLKTAVKEQIEFKGYGAWRIVSNLRQKGFEKQEILAIYHDLTNQEEESLRAREFAEKRWPGIRGKNLTHRKKKLSDQLLRQGFSYEILSEILENLEE